MKVIEIHKILEEGTEWGFYSKDRDTRTLVAQCLMCNHVLTDLFEEANIRARHNPRSDIIKLQQPVVEPAKSVVESESVKPIVEQTKTSRKKDKANESS